MNGVYHNRAARAGTSTTSIRCATTRRCSTSRRTSPATAIIWARSAWAGSQRYPLHWGGDAENTNSAMAAQLRGGLSIGLSGFTYWSHDAGGFVQRAPRDLYRRWLAFGVLDLAHAHARRAAARAVGVRRRARGGLPARDRSSSTR